MSRPRTFLFALFVPFVIFVVPPAARADDLISTCFRVDARVFASGGSPVTSTSQGRTSASFISIDTAGQAVAGNLMTSTNYQSGAGYGEQVQPPVLNFAVAKSSALTKVYLRFSEPMDTVTVTNIANYTLSGGLFVTAAELTVDKVDIRNVVTLTTSANVTIDTTTVTASNAIKSAKQRNIAQTTKTIQSGMSDGFPDAVSLGLALSTDNSKSVIQQNGPIGFDIPNNGLKVNLTVTVSGTTAKTIDITQATEPGGAGAVFMGATGTAASTTVTTSGGTPNRASVILRANTTSAFQNDFKLIASEAGTQLFTKFATVISLSITPQCVYISDQRPVKQDLTVTPAIAGLEIVSTRFLVTRASHASPTVVRPVSQWPPTDANGKAVRFYQENAGTDKYAVQSNNPCGADGYGHETDDREPDPCTKCKEGCGSSAKSVDPADGEKKLSETDLVIKGRGFDYAFRRSYRSWQYRQKLGNHRDFGENWVYNYADDFLVKDGTGTDATANYTRFEEEFTTGVFVNVTSGQWESSLGRFEQIRVNASTGDLEIRDRGGNVRVYNNFSVTATPNKNGRLKEMRDRNDNRMTFFYEQIDPNADISGDDKFVLAFVVDTLGREIRYQYYAKTNQTVNGRQVTIASSNQSSYGHLARVVDFKDNMTFSASPTQPQDFPGQVRNRTLVFDYDNDGNLVRVSGPAVAATPSANDFPSGKTTRYKYITPKDLPAGLTADESLQLLHKLTHIWYPNEVKSSPTVNPADSDAAEVITYETDNTKPFFGFAISRFLGGTNGNNVPSGGTLTYTYTDLNPTRSFTTGVGNPEGLNNLQTLKVAQVDRNGNTAEMIYGGARNLLEQREKTRGLRAGEPVDFFTQSRHNQDYLPKSAILPESNSSANTHNVSSTDRFQQGSQIRIVRTPDGTRGGDQPKIEMVIVYNPIYNMPCLFVYARGADMNNNGFTPPISDPASRTMTDPYDATKTLNMRYVQVEFFDFQESPEKASQAPATRMDKDGSGGQVNLSPLISVDANVLTTEVWLVQILGLTENSAGLTELRNRLNNNLTSLGLGDLNGDNDTTPTVAGNIIRTVYGSPVLIANTNQHKIETDIETAGDLIDQTKTYGNGGTNEGTQGNRLQTIVWMYQYNKFGQLIQTISPEGNVTTHECFPENDPDGDTVVTPAPADGRTLGTQDSAADRTNGGGGYVHFTVVDRTRTDSYVKFFDQAGVNKATATFNNNKAAPTATDIKTCACIYDDVGNLIQRHNPRGIRDDYFVNELDQVVQVTRAADVSEAATANPPDPLVGATIGPLTAFTYKTRTFLDFNDQVVLAQVEDRGNNSSVDGSGLGTLPTQATDTAPGLASADNAGGNAFVDTLDLYDRLNDLIETRGEVDSTRSLNTRYRYDGNQYQVLTIYPEGNADSKKYDERRLVFQHTRGASMRPSEGRYAVGDPSTFDRSGGSGTTPSTVTCNYDKNQNLIEYVDAANTDGSAINSSSIAGGGDVTAYTYDGYDRRKTFRDVVGNIRTYVYDPDSNVVRMIQDGEPLDDVVPATFPDANNKTLAVREYIHDELSRIVCTHRVLFQTPVAAPSRTPTLTDTPSMDTLAAYLSDASTDTSAVPGATGITVIGRVTTLTEFDRESRATFAVLDDLDVYAAGYDGSSRVILTEDSLKNNGFSGGAFNPANLDGNLVEMAYDDNDNVIEQKETDVTIVANVAAEVFRTTSLYDALDRRQSRVDNTVNVVNNAHATDFRYDSRSNLVVQADAVGPVTTRALNRRGLGSTASVTVNDFGNVARSRYDGVSRLLETEMRLTSNGQGDGTNIGATLEGVLSTAPTVDTAQSGDGLISVYYAYDDNSQLLALRDDDGNTTAYLYDNQNRTKVERKGVAFTGTSFTITGGDSGTFSVALRGGMTPVDTEASGTDITYTFDQDNNITTAVDEAGNSQAYTFDALNRRKSCAITRAGGFIGTTSQTWKYDGLTRLTQCFDNNEPTPTDDDVTCKYCYDSLSRKVEEQQQIGSLSTKALSCNYDIVAGGAGMRESACFYPDGRRTDCIYDRLDRLETRRDNGQASDIGKYEYIGKWRVAVLTYQNKTRLTHIGQSSGQNADLGFDTLRRVVNHRWESFTTQALGNGTLVVGFEHQDGNGPATPMYDRVNDKRIEHKTHDPANSEQYKYDSAYRLTSTGSGSQGVDTRGFEQGMFTSANRTSMAGGVAFFQDWDLEGLGNWTREDDNARVETRTHSDYNEIVQRTVSANNSGLTHDKNGNTTDTGNTTLGGQSFPGGGLRMEWDALNRLRKAYTNNNTTGNTADDIVKAEYTYDCGNRRMRKRLPGPNNTLDAFGPGNDDQGTDFYYNGWRVVEERTPTLTANPPTADTIAQQYTYGNYLDEAWTLDDRRSGIAIAQLNDGAGAQRLFYHANTLYHVYGLTDETGALKEAYQYDAYGTQTVITDGNDPDTVVNFNANDVRGVGAASSVNNPNMYTGLRFDAETGLLLFRTRYYSPQLGRFVARDLAGYKGSPNLYAYVVNNPANYTDPFGWLLVAVDGTGSEDYLASAPEITQVNSAGTSVPRVRSHVRNFYADYGAKKNYWRGPHPGFWYDLNRGSDCPFIHRSIMDWLGDEWCKDRTQPIDLVGHSRGGYIVMEIARTLQKQGIKCNCKRYYPRVRWMGLYDPVDMAPGYGEAETVPSNVDKAEIVAPDTGAQYVIAGLGGAAVVDEYPKSRAFFNRADHGAEDSSMTGYHVTPIPGTHSALGGAPWDGPHPGGKHSQANDIKSAEAADRAIRASAQGAGVQVPSISKYGY